MFLVLISVRSWVDPRAIVWSKDFVNEKYQWHQQKLNPQPSSQYRSVSTMSPRAPLFESNNKNVMAEGIICTYMNDNCYSQMLIQNTHGTNILPQQDHKNNSQWYPQVLIYEKR